MKKILSILGSFVIIGTSTTGIVSCGEEPKCENKIIGNLKEICKTAPQKVSKIKKELY